MFFVCLFPKIDAFSYVWILVYIFCWTFWSALVTTNNHIFADSKVVMGFKGHDSIVTHWIILMKLAKSVDAVSGHWIILMNSKVIGLCLFYLFKYFYLRENLHLIYLFCFWYRLFLLLLSCPNLEKVIYLCVWFISQF